MQAGLACYTVPQDSSIPASALACTCWHTDLRTYADLALDSPTGERRRVDQLYGACMREEACLH